jgi:hypothetical protein
MRKYNRRILTALVVAYKKGIINRKPLNRWLNFKEIFYRSAKYIIYLALFSIMFVIIEKGFLNYFTLDERVYIGNYYIQKSRIFSGLIIGILAFNIYQLSKYLHQVITVKRAMRKYKATDNNVEILNSVTYKIKVR